MTYHLNPELGKIEFPVRVRVSGENEISFVDGQELAAHDFSKPYIVSSIKVVEDSIEITLTENKTADITWIGKEQSFF